MNLIELEITTHVTFVSELSFKGTEKKQMKLNEVSITAHVIVCSKKIRQELNEGE